jgi:hypothetical protein
MATEKTNLLILPGLLPTCWWKPLVADGYSLERVSEVPNAGYWSYGGDIDKVIKPKSSADVQKSRALTIGGRKTLVVVFRDIKEDTNWVDGSRPFWVWYYCDRKVDSWLSRVFLASGAKRGWCRLGFNALFTRSDDCWSPPKGEFKELGEVAPCLHAVDKFAFLVSRKGVEVTFYFGKHVDHQTEQIKTYAAIEYGTNWLRKRQSEDLSRESYELILSFGFEETRYHHLAYQKNKRGRSWDGGLFLSRHSSL